MQHDPWKPPVAGPGDVFASAVSVIFDSGLPDPRGCEYRQVSVPRLLLAGRMQIVQTQGWVLPAAADAQQFAICWDGLNLPVAGRRQAGGPEGDAAAALRQEEKLLTEFETANPGRQYSTLWDPQGPGQAVSPDGALPLRACMLLRLGQADLANQLWQTAMMDYGTTMSVAIHKTTPTWCSPSNGPGRGINARWHTIAAHRPSGTEGTDGLALATRRPAGYFGQRAPPSSSSMTSRRCLAEQQNPGASRT